MDQRPVQQNQTITPVKGTVLIEIITNAELLGQELKSKSGLFLQRNILQGQPKSGKVYKISEDIENPDFEIGDIVIFKHQEMFSGFKFNGLELASIPKNDIVGKYVNG